MTTVWSRSASPSQPGHPTVSNHHLKITGSGGSAGRLETLLDTSSRFMGRWLEDGWCRSEEGRPDSWLLSPVGNLYTRS